MPAIAILTDQPGWHGQELTAAFVARGFACQYQSTLDYRIDIARSGVRVMLSRFARRMPLAVFVRGVPGGTLEQVILRLNVLHCLAALGVIVYNNQRGIEKTVDKAMTSFLLKQAGLPTPNTWICETRAEAESIYQRECQYARNKLVVKPLFGSQGIGIHLLDSTTGLIDDPAFGGVYYLQSYIDCGEQAPFDIRVFVIGGRAVAAMRRRGKSWITNRTQGGRCEPLRLDSTLCQLSEAAVFAVGVDYGGVDLIADADGCLQVIEVNSIPAWRGLQEVTDFNIASQLVDDLVCRLPIADVPAVARS